MLDNGRKRVNQLQSIVSNRDINLSAQRFLLLSVIRPSMEYHTIDTIAHGTGLEAP